MSRRRRGKPADPVRVVAAGLVGRWLAKDLTIQRLIERFEQSREKRKKPWPYAQRRRLRELALGTVRLKGRYEFMVTGSTRRGTEIEPDVAAVLWTALHQVTEMQVPAFAAVSQAVTVAEKLGLHRAASFINGVLRGVLRAGLDSGFPDPAQDPLAYAIHWHSHPRWLVERWAKRMSTDDVLALCAVNNRRPRLTLRAPARGRRRVEAKLEEMGWEWEKLPHAPAALQLRTRVPAPLLLHTLGKAGPVAIQDAASQAVGRLLVAGDRGGRILDLCAAPGGKATQMADLAGPNAWILATDPSLRRLRRLSEAASRMDLENLEIVAADGRHPPFGLDFDRVLVDAPCTGTGVLSRRHEARWRRSPADLETLPPLQRELLHRALDATRPGGEVVYATCSLEPEENDAVVDAVLAAREDVEEVGVEDRCASELVDGLRLRAWPHRHGTDGAFAALLRRKETP